ncbi:uncharacterized protein LOC111832115 [Capsella rubella]|uniref:uncharacterized protein LOC111832115 n=1 Tax=Capsella rubella TaxID=81985 RepID=UPI000CD4C0B9|nr:uncharacterized protein LOC111832115 [Capsella rubella]
MECNKDEARRAMDIAERKVSENDYIGAKKFVNKAQILYPNLDGLKQVLMMIDVYIFASNREADWYGVLSVDPLADDDAVKRQYKKLALLLHPDKNRSRELRAYDHKRKTKEAKNPPNPPRKPASHNVNTSARGGVDTSAGATSAKPACGMPKPPNPPRKPASHNVNQNARRGVDTSARATSDKPACGMPKPPNPHKPASSYEHQNARDCMDPSPKARSYMHALAPTDSFK